MKKIVVDKKYNEKDLISFLLASFDGLSLNIIYKALRRKDIRINNIKINQNCIVHSNDEITLFVDSKMLYKHFNLDIVYEDDNIVVLNKPCGIEVVRNR